MTNPFQELVAMAGERPNVDEWDWVTVTSLSPLEVARDGDDPVGGVVNLGSAVAVGDRVWAQFAKRRVFLHGGRDVSQRQPFAEAVGTVSITASDGIGSAYVTFPSGRFTVTPQVFTTAGSGSAAVVNTQYGGSSVDGATIYSLRTNSTATTVRWHAIQMTPTSASG